MGIRDFNVSEKTINFFRMSKICLSVLIFALIGLTSSFNINQYNQCPSSTDCSQCDAFNSNSNFNFASCEKSCELCPLCALFKDSPIQGCQYCNEGTQKCQEDCILGEQICKKCKECYFSYY